MQKSTMVICCGSAVVDHVFHVESIPESSGKVPCASYREAGGGLAATAAVAIAALGGDAVFWGVLGQDNNGTLLRGLLEASGVDVSSVIVDETASTPVSSILVDRAGERQCAFYPGRRPVGIERTMPLERIGEAGAVLVDVRWVGGALSTLDAARAAKVPSVLDVDVSDRDDIGQLVERADHTIFSKGGLECFTGVDSPQSGLLRAAEMTAGKVGVTLGGNGYLWLQNGEIRHEPAFGVDVVDTNGAGDTFHGAYALSVAKGGSISTAVRFANAAAAVKCTKSGGWARMPSLRETENLLTGRME